MLFDLGASGNEGPVRKAEFADLMSKAVKAPGGELLRQAPGAFFFDQTAHALTLMHRAAQLLRSRNRGPP